MNPLPDPQPAGGIDAEGAEAPTVGEAGVAATTEQQAQAQVGVATAAQPSAQLTREQALQQAQAEGLTLRKAHNTSGHVGVSATGRVHRYLARVHRSGKDVHLGCYATAEEAALAYARTPEAQAQVVNGRPAPLLEEGGESDDEGEESGDEEYIWDETHKVPSAQQPRLPVLRPNSLYSLHPRARPGRQTLSGRRRFQSGFHPRQADKEGWHRVPDQV